MAEVTLQNVHMVYGKKTPALRGINLTIRDGEFFVLLGPSGCGKTTLLRMISGIDRPTEGDVLFDGVSVRDKKPQDRNIAMVFQSFALYPHMTVYKNIAYPLASRKMKKDEIDRKVREIAELFGITVLLDKRPRVLSGGQRQLVAIARAMVREPNIFLLDEPFSNLDVELRDMLRAQVRKAHALMPGTTFLYVTHDQTEAMGLSDRMALMRDGEIVMCGTGREVYSNPADVYTAQFIGTPKINLIPGTLRRRETGFEVCNDALDKPIPVFIREEATEGRLLLHADGKTAISLDVLIGIRPEWFRIPEEAGQESAAVQGTFRGLARAGAGVQVLFSIPGMGETFCSSVTVPSVLPEEGGPIRFAVKNEDVVIFREEDGKNISRTSENEKEGNGSAAASESKV